MGPSKYHLVSACAAVVSEATVEVRHGGDLLGSLSLDITYIYHFEMETCARPLTTAWESSA